MKKRSVSISTGGGGAGGAGSTIGPVQDFSLHHGGDIVIPDDNRRGGCDNASVTHRQHK